MKSIRFLALLLCAALLLPLVPVHAAQSGGSFYLTASTAGQTLIEPVAVPYTPGRPSGMPCAQRLCLRRHRYRVHHGHRGRRGELYGLL